MRAIRIASIVTDDGIKSAVVTQRTPARSYGMQFHTTFTHEAAKIARTITSGATLRLFIVLPEHLDYVTFRRLDQVKIGAELGMGQSSISRSLKELVEAGVVERRGKGPLVEWRLSPDYGWRGDVESFHAEQGKRRKKPGALTGSPAPIVAEGRLSKPPQRNLRLFSSVVNRSEDDNIAPLNAACAATRSRIQP